MTMRAWVGLIAAGWAALPPVGPAAAQSWNLYGNGGSFYVPITTQPNLNGGPPQYLVSLTLNGSSQPNSFILDTGSLGLVADPNHYTFSPAKGDIQLAPYATITYSTSGANPVGALYLTNVQINGAGGQSVTARVPILGASNDGFHQLGIGFDRSGIMIGQNASSTAPASNSYNMNPFLALVSGTNTNVSTMQPGYIIGVNGFQNLGLGPGVLLGLNSQNTSGFAFQQLASNGGLPSYCSVAGMGCPLNWSSQNGSISVTTNGRTYNLGSASQLPDSGISYMIVNAPGNTIPVSAGNCSDGSGTPQNCLASGTVQVFLPGQSQPAYSFTLGDTGNPSVPFGVQVTRDAPPSNLGRTFFDNLNYLYDPINGFVGYQAAGTNGTTATIIPMLALQGNLTLPNGFLSSFTTFLMGGLTLQQTGSGTLSGPIIGPGGLTLQSGSVTLGGKNAYGGGTIVNGGMLTVAGTGSLTGDVTVNNGGGFTNNGTLGDNGLLTVNAGGSFTNNGTVNTPIQWQLNQGSFTNNGTFNGSLANTGTATNNATLTGSVINTNTGTFINNGAVTGSVANMGVWNGNGSIGGNMVNSGMMGGNATILGNLANSGVLSPGNSIGTISVTGNLVQSSSGTYLTEVVGQGQSDRVTVGGAASLGGTVVVSALPGLPFAPSTTYTILSAAGGLGGTTFGAVNELYPFLQSSLSYDANNAYLTLQVGGFAAAAQNPTQFAVGSALDRAAPTATGDFATVLGTLATQSASQVLPVLTSLSGMNYSGFSSSMVQGAQLFMNNFLSQAGGGSPGGNRLALAEACDVACDTVSPPPLGRLGRRAGRSRHGRSEPEPGRPHLQCRRLRRRPRPGDHGHFPRRRDGGPLPASTVARQPTPSRVRTSSAGASSASTAHTS